MVFIYIYKYIKHVEFDGLSQKEEEKGKILMVQDNVIHHWAELIKIADPKFWDSVQSVVVIELIKSRQFTCLES